VAEESDLERTEPASSRRLEQAREEGNVPQSRELMAFMVLAAGAGAFWVLGGWLSQRSSNLLRHGLSFSREAAFDTSLMTGWALSLTTEAFVIAAPVFLLAIAAAIVTPFMIGGAVISPKAFQLDLNRMDPIKGLGADVLVAEHCRTGQGHSQGAADRRRSLLGSPARAEPAVCLARPAHRNGIVSFAEVLLHSFLALIAGLALIAAIDVPFQLWQYHDRLKMTNEELKREARESEGDPYLKARIRSQQREMARSRMMSEVPKADVVVTNPTHFAVALKYESGKMGAPVVVAKGMNLLAQRIRDLAGENQVPVLEAPPLARALYRHADVGDQIPAPLYTAVAEVMAWVYQLNQFALAAGDILPPVAPAAHRRAGGHGPRGS
jgi:flagellar biosynthetic protein FlhB